MVLVIVGGMWKADCESGYLNGDFWTASVKYMFDTGRFGLGLLECREVEGALAEWADRKCAYIMGK